VLVTSSSAAAAAPSSVVSVAAASSSTTIAVEEDSFDDGIARVDVIVLLSRDDDDDALALDKHLAERLDFSRFVFKARAETAAEAVAARPRNKGDEGEALVVVAEEEGEEEGQQPRAIISFSSSVFFCVWLFEEGKIRQMPILCLGFIYLGFSASRPRFLLSQTAQTAR